MNKLQQRSQHNTNIKLSDEGSYQGEWQPYPDHTRGPGTTPTSNSARKDQSRTMTAASRSYNIQHRMEATVRVEKEKIATEQGVRQRKIKPKQQNIKTHTRDWKKPAPSETSSRDPSTSTTDIILPTKHRRKSGTRHHFDTSHEMKKKEKLRGRSQQKFNQKQETTYTKHHWSHRPTKMMKEPSIKIQNGDSRNQTE